MNEYIALVTVKQNGQYQVHTAITNVVLSPDGTRKVAVTDCGKILKVWRPSHVPPDADWDTFDFRYRITRQTPCPLCKEIKEWRKAAGIQAHNGADQAEIGMVRDKEDYRKYWRIQL